MPIDGRAWYRNPVIEADYSDPDVIRMGDEYWMTASTFNRAPGLPILRSSDLVHWEHVANALPAVPPYEHYAVPRRGCGVWAPSLRQHDGVVYIVYPDPDQGIWVLTAESPLGPWSQPHLLVRGAGRIDPCPLWDDDGRTYLVQAWARSRSGFTNRLSVMEVSADLREVVGPTVTVIDGDDIAGFTTLEGPKFYKRDGWYWIFAPAGGVATGWQSVFRSRSPLGPYEERTVLAQGDTQVNGPHQGAWVDTPDGDSWFLHFSDRDAFGRVVLLQPMAWGRDGWPTMGTPGPDGVGQPVLEHPSPAGARPDGHVRRLPYDDDEFRGPLGLQWYWQANPDPGWLELPGDGRLRLAAVTEDRGDLRHLGNVLAQRLPAHPLTATTSVAIARGETPDGWRCGVVVMGETYTWAGLEVRAGEVFVTVRTFDDAALGEVDLMPPVALGDVAARIDQPVHLAVTVSNDAALGLWWSLDGRSWSSAGHSRATAGLWVGAELGFVATAPLGTLGDLASAVVTPLLLKAEDVSTCTSSPFSHELADLTVGGSQDVGNRGPS